MNQLIYQPPLKIHVKHTINLFKKGDKYLFNPISYQEGIHQLLFLIQFQFIDKNEEVLSLANPIPATENKLSKTLSRETTI